MRKLEGEMLDTRGAGTVSSLSKRQLQAVWQCLAEFLRQKFGKMNG
jgi:hypothetical protein